MRDALDATGGEIVTVALRRADLSGANDPFANILEFIDPKKFLVLPNTSGAMDAQEAIRLARLAAAAGLPKWVKLEIHPDPRYLLPDPVETLKAAEQLVSEGFTVLPYINADPVLAKGLQAVGTATVMPLGSPIGSNQGVATRDQIRIIIEQAEVPVVVDAGLGAPSHAAEAMELGADAVLINTAIAVCQDPVRMAMAFKKAVQAGREAYEIGLGATEHGQRIESVNGLSGSLVMPKLPSMDPLRAQAILEAGMSQRILVVGDVMLDQFIWGQVTRISPEAPVPVLDFQDERYMPGGAANVARNLTAWNTDTVICSWIGRDVAGDHLIEQLKQCQVGCMAVCSAVLPHDRTENAHRCLASANARVDRERREPITTRQTEQLLKRVERHLTSKVSAVILCDYGKGVVTQELLDSLTVMCRQRGIWLSMDPKPVKPLHLKGLSMTPNRKELFALARRPEVPGTVDPLKDRALHEVIAQLMTEAAPAMMLVTLGERGMLLCQRGQEPFHIPTMAREVYDVSGAGDTAIAAFTLAISGGASPVEAAILANHAAGVVVGKGTATHSLQEWLNSVRDHG